MFGLKFEFAFLLPWLVSPVAFDLQLVLFLFELTLVVNGVSSSVLLHKVNMLTVALAMNIKDTNIVLTCTVNRIVVNGHHYYHVEIFPVLLELSLPFYLTSNRTLGLSLRRVVLSLRRILWRILSLRRIVLLLWLVDGRGRLSCDMDRCLAI